MLGNFILKSDYEITGDEDLKLYLNNIEKQNAKLNTMIFSPAELVKYISNRISLEKGDLIFTGTPAGVGETQKGDKLKVEISNIPILETEII